MAKGGLVCLVVGCIKPLKRFQSTSRPPKQYTVTLDNETLYINEDVARALGWSPETGHAGVKLTLHGWEPRFFAIAPTGSDSERLARSTIESGHDPNVRTVLEYLKDR